MDIRTGNESDEPPTAAALAIARRKALRLFRLARARPDWRCLIAPMAHRLRDGRPLDHWGHVVARTAFTNELCGLPAISARFDEWGKKTGLHAAAGDLAVARDRLVKALEPAEREQLWRFSADRFPDGIVLGSFMSSNDGVMVGAIWVVESDAIGDFMLAMPDYVLPPFQGEERDAIRHGAAQVAKKRDRFIAAAREQKRCLPRLAQKAARDLGLDWPWAASDLRDVFVVDLYRRAFGVSIKRTLYLRRGAPPPFTFELFRGKFNPSLDEEIARGRRELTEYIDRLMRPQRPPGSPPRPDTIEAGARWLARERLGAKPGELKRAWHDEKKHTRPYRTCKCGNRPMQHRAKALRLLGLAGDGI